MFNLKSIKEFLIVLALFTSICFFLNGLVYFLIKIDETEIESTRYCPNCGIDLVERR